MKDALESYIETLPHARRVGIAACIRRIQTMMAQLPGETVVAIDYVSACLREEKPIRVDFDKEALNGNRHSSYLGSIQPPDGGGR